MKRRHSGGRRVRGGRQGVGREYHAAGAAAAAAAAMWSQVPVLVLEKVYALLALSDRYACSCVCRHWYSVFRSAVLWRHLNIARRTFTRRKVRYRPARDTGPTTLTRSILSVESNQNVECKTEKCAVENSIFTSRNQVNHYNGCHRMSDFKAKMHQSPISARAPPLTAVGGGSFGSTMLPRTF